MLLLSFTLLSFAKETQFPEAVRVLGDASVNWTAMRLDAVNSYDSRSESWERRETWASLALGTKIKESVMHLPISDKSTVGKIIDKNQTLSRSLQIGLEEWKTHETRYIQNANEVEVMGSLDLKQYLRQTVMEYSSNKVKEMKPKIHSGLLIDTRGLNFQPVVFPTVQTPSNADLIQISGFSRDAAQDTMPVLYVVDPAHPKSAKKLGGNAAVIRAQHAADGTISIHPEDMTRMPSNEDLKALISSGKIVIIID